MTTTNIYAPTRDVGNGVTVAFTFNFKLDDETDLDVFLIDTAASTNKVLQTITTQYTVDINTTSEGGTVTFLTAPPSTKDVILERTEDFTQPQDIPDVATIQESTLEGGFDKNTRLIQQVLEITNRRIGLSVEEDSLLSNFNYNLKNTIANGLLQINTTRTGIETTAVAALSGITIPITSGIAVHTGSGNFIAREIISTGSATVTNPTGVAGNIDIDLTTTDANIALKAATADLISTSAAKGTALIGDQDPNSYFTGTTLRLILDEIFEAGPLIKGRVNANGTVNNTSSRQGFTFSILSHPSAGIYNTTLTGLPVGEVEIVATIHGEGGSTFHTLVPTDISTTTGFGTKSGFRVQLSKQTGAGATLIDINWSFTVRALP